jgi:hypothetical protein
LNTFAPAVGAGNIDPRAILAWEPLARTARTLLPEEFARIDRATGAAFPFSADRLQAAHAQWTADWLGWERTHDAEYKLKAAAVEDELARSDGSALVRARLDAVEREKLDLYQRRYAEYARRKGAAGPRGKGWATERPRVTRHSACALVHRQRSPTQANLSVPVKYPLSGSSSSDSSSGGLFSLLTRRVTKRVHGLRIWGCDQRNTKSKWIPASRHTPRRFRGLDRRRLRAWRSACHPNRCAARDTSAEGGGRSRQSCGSLSGSMRSILRIWAGAASFRGEIRTPCCWNGEAVVSLSGRSPSSSSLKTPGAAAAVVRMTWPGANRRVRPAGLEPATGVSNYLIGNDPARWRLGVPSFGRVRYRDLYPGIDLVFYGNQERLEYDFVVASGGDPRAIRLRFSGEDAIRIDANGDLVVRAGSAEIVQQAPVVYQEHEGTRQLVAGRYVKTNRHEVGFVVAP